PRGAGAGGDQPAGQRPPAHAPGHPRHPRRAGRGRRGDPDGRRQRPRLPGRGAGGDLPALPPPRRAGRRRGARRGPGAGDRPGDRRAARGPGVGGERARAGGGLPPRPAPRRGRGRAGGGAMPLKLLIAEDDRDLAEVVAYGARQAWPDCRITIAADGREALKRFAEERPDLVVLDVTMPPPDGLEVCRRIRRTSRVPILMLTVRRNTLDKVRALDLGADDYLTKPFDHLELFARLRALVRRADDAPAPES